MSKKSKAAQEMEHTDAGANSDLDFGYIPEDLSGKLTEVETQQTFPTFCAGQEGFMEGDVKAGKYLGTERIYSEKFNNPKIDAQGRKYRDLHHFEHPKAGRFGIWNSGVLGNVMRGVEKGKFIAIEYTGVADTPFKKGQAAPHTFAFRGDGIQLKTASFEDIYEAEAAAEYPANMNRETGELMNERMPS